MIFSWSIFRLFPGANIVLKEREIHVKTWPRSIILTSIQLWEPETDNLEVTKTSKKWKSQCSFCRHQAYDDWDCNLNIIIHMVQNRLGLPAIYCFRVTVYLLVLRFTLLALLTSLNSNWMMWIRAQRRWPFFRLKFAEIHPGKDCQCFVFIFK